MKTKYGTPIRLIGPAQLDDSLLVEVIETGRVTDIKKDDVDMPGDDLEQYMSEQGATEIAEATGCEVEAKPAYTHKDVMELVEAAKRMSEAGEGITKYGRTIGRKPFVALRQALKPFKEGKS